MSLSKQITIWCDQEGCQSFLQADTGNTWEARRLALAEGWSPATHGGLASHGEDLCPGHKNRGGS